MNWSIVKEPTILITAAVYGLLSLIVSQSGLFGMWLGILLSFSIWRYCYAVLRAAAQGRARIPAPDAESFNIVGEWGVFWHLVLFPGLFVVGLIYQPLGLIVAVIVAVAFPASAALMGITSNITHSLNPSAMMEVMRILGADYFAVVLGYIAVLLGGFVLAFLIGTQSGLLALLLTFCVEYWAMFASFALIGAALRAHRLEFEIPGEVVPREEEALKHQHEQWHKDLDIAYTSFRSGLNAAGYETLHRLVDENGDSLEVNHWLVENMIDWWDTKYALEVVAKLMPRLLAAGNGAAALELYQRCRRRDPEFRPPPPQAEKLAEHARAFGHTGIADELSYN
jgi:hypothetical protein